MSAAQILEQALTLGPDERAELANAIWESIEQPRVSTREVAIIDEVLRRDADVEAGRSTLRPHAEVMAEARRRLGCA